MIAHYRLRLPGAWEARPDPDTGGTIRIMTAFDTRLHVNIAARDMTPALEPYRIHPETPSMAMAGDGGPSWPLTAFLRFADEDQMSTALGEQP